MRLSVPLALGTIPTLSHHLGSNSTEVTLSKGWSPSTIHLPCQDRGTATYGKVRLAVEEDDITITHVSFHHVARFSNSQPSWWAREYSEILRANQGEAQNHQMVHRSINRGQYGYGEMGYPNLMRNNKKQWESEVVHYLLIFILEHLRFCKDYIYILYIYYYR